MLQSFFRNNYDIYFIIIILDMTFYTLLLYITVLKLT
jgi:hypothetical protein